MLSTLQPPPKEEWDVQEFRLRPASLRTQFCNSVHLPMHFTLTFQQRDHFPKALRFNAAVFSAFVVYSPLFSYVMRE